MHAHALKFLIVSPEAKKKQRSLSELLTYAQGTQINNLQAF